MEQGTAHALKEEPRGVEVNNSLVYELPFDPGLCRQQVFNLVSYPNFASAGRTVEFRVVRINPRGGSRPSGGAFLEIVDPTCQKARSFLVHETLTQLPLEALLRILIEVAHPRLPETWARSFYSFVSSRPDIEEILTNAYGA